MTTIFRYQHLMKIVFFLNRTKNRSIHRREIIRRYRTKFMFRVYLKKIKKILILKYRRKKIVNYLLFNNESKNRCKKNAKIKK